MCTTITYKRVACGGCKQYLSKKDKEEICPAAKGKYGKCGTKTKTQRNAPHPAGSTCPNKDR